MESFKEITTEQRGVNLDNMHVRFVDGAEIETMLKEQGRRESREQILTVIEEITEHLEDIKVEVEKRLARYLPNYTYPNVHISLSLIRDSNFESEGDRNVSGDLGRLVNDPHKIETLTQGLTHELFHVWYKNQDSERVRSRYEVLNTEKAKRIFKTIDEGCAVFISRQNLEEFYKARRNEVYDPRAAFQKFNEYLSTTDETAVRELDGAGYRAMGFFYVVGNEIVRTIAQHEGDAAIRELLAAEDLLGFYEYYRHIAVTYSELPEIDLGAMQEVIRRGRESGEKPKTLFIGTQTAGIAELEPRRGRHRGVDEGPVIFAARDKGLAAIFLIEGHNDSWMKIGYFEEVPHVVICMDRNEFIARDTGGVLYEVPSDTFDFDPNLGMRDKEWTSHDTVKPLSGTRCVSALDTMIENGVYVYFVDREQFEKITGASDHGFSEMAQLQSENELRDPSCKTLREAVERNQS